MYSLSSRLLNSLIVHQCSHCILLQDPFLVSGRTGIPVTWPVEWYRCIWCRFYWLDRNEAVLRITSSLDPATAFCCQSLVHSSASQSDVALEPVVAPRTMLYWACQDRYERWCIYVHITGNFHNHDLPGGESLKSNLVDKVKVGSFTLSCARR